VRYYLDGTAIVRAVSELPESDALRAWLEDHHAELATSILARWEAGEELVGMDHNVRMRILDQLGGIPEISISGRALEIGSYAVAAVRPYAALHVGLAAADEGVTVLVTYNSEVASAARLYGLRVVSPGREPGWYLS
jgi:uncharacterized protein with PIN domain